MNKLQLIDADTLYYKPLAHPKMLIDGVLSDGLAILAGDSKIGKSWMVLWLCLQISRGEAVWGLPTRKTDVVYLALEDREWRVQQRMQELTDSPPENLRFGFSCGQLGAELEGQIEETLREFPSTGLIFIDTLQMVRDNTSAKVNAYAQDYKDLSGLKKLADDHGICIFVVHHTRKERDSSNIFNDMTGSTGILGVADTGMILRKDDRFGDCATLCITGRDVEEKKLKMQMRGVRWEITEALSAKDLRKERIPDFVFQVADFLLAHGRFRGTVSQLLAAVGNTELKPNLASKHLTRHYSHVLRKIQECARAALMDGKAVADRLTNTCEAEQQEQREAMERSLTRDEERIEVLDKMVMRLYEDMIAGRISEQNFNTMLEKTQTEQTELKAKVSEGRKRLSDEAQLANDAKQWVEAIQEYANITELDAATLNRLIKEIVVHERIDEDKTRHISIEIHFNLKPIPEVEQVTA